MDRADKIAEELDNHLLEQIEAALIAAEKEFELHKDVYIQSFQKCLSECAVQAELFQKQGKKGAIRYISVSILQSSLLSKTYEIRIDLQDNQGFMAMPECCSYWVPEFIIPYLELDERAIRLALAGNVMRVKSYEVLEIQHTYRALIFCYLAYFINELAEQAEVMLRKLACEMEVWVLYGNYMEKNQYISKIQMKELEDNEILLP